MSNEYLNNKAFEAVIERFQRTHRDRTKYQLIVEDFQTAGERPGKKKPAVSKAHATAKERHKTACQEFKECQDELACMFYALSESIVRWRRFSLIDADDSVQEGVLICFEKVARFDPSKGSAFPYLTTCVLNHFRQLWRTARNYNELKIKYQDYLCASFEDTVARNLRERLKNYRAVSAYEAVGSDGKI